jgi:hypothetical protein
MDAGRSETFAKSRSRFNNKRITLNVILKAFMDIQYLKDHMIVVE